MSFENYEVNVADGDDDDDDDGTYLCGLPGGLGSELLTGGFA